MILLVPVMTILLVVTVVFFQRFYEDLTRQMTSSVVQEVGVILARLEGATDAAGALELAAPLGFEVGPSVVGDEPAPVSGSHRSHRHSDVTHRADLSAQPDAPDPPPGACSRGVWQGPRRALPASRCD